MLTISVRLRDGGYDAATADPRTGEWPPHPARVFCALVASARDEEDFAALRWLEASGRPHVRASSIAEVTMAEAVGYVVTNAVDTKGGGSQTWIGRTNNRRERTAVRPRHDAFAVVWPDADPDDATLARLVRLAGRVPYVGRSTATAEVVVTVDDVAERDGWASFTSVAFGEAADGEWRMPYVGYVDDLRDAYESGRRAWEVARRFPFREGDPPAAKPAPVASPFDDLVVYSVTSSAVAGRDVLELTSALRRAVMKLVPDPLPPLLSGHGADGRTHVAFVALPDVGHAHADGHLLGVALALPAEMPTAERATMFRALDDTLKTLNVGSRNIPLTTTPAGSWGLRRSRWTAAPKGSHVWTTATPLMLDRFVKASADIEAEVAGAIVRAGYPEPTSVAVRRVSFVEGGVTGVRWGRAVASRPRRPMFHVRASFGARVVGPVLAGSMRYLGLGLFVPVRGEAET